MRAARGSGRPLQRPAPEAGNLSLGAALTIREVGACHRQLQRLLRADSRGPAGAIDARSLRSIDTAGLQLLLVAGRAAQQRGSRLAIRGASELLKQAAAELGLDGALGATLELRS